jgi:hypothetical protein
MWTSDIPSSIGLGMIILGIVAVLVELGLVAFHAHRLERRVANLRGLITLETGLMMIDLAHLGRLRQERERALRPFRRLQRMAGHPITAALLGSLRRRLLA